MGHHLGLRIHQQDVTISQVFSRKKRKAQALTKLLNATPIHNLQSIDSQADLYILAVSDDAIALVAEQLSSSIAPNALVVHTSGATPRSILKPFFKRYGILYPLQTFSINKPIDFSKVPVCIDANRKSDRLKLKRFAKLLSNKVVELNDAQRARLHVAAVFANNFSNYMYTAAHTITEAEDLDFDLLRPLIEETAAKLQDALPLAMQTGPARRGDQHTHRPAFRLSGKIPRIAEVISVG